MKTLIKLSCLLIALTACDDSYSSPDGPKDFIKRTSGVFTNCSDPSVDSFEQKGDAYKNNVRIECMYDSNGLVMREKHINIDNELEFYEFVYFWGQNSVKIILITCENGENKDCKINSPIIAHYNN